MRRALTLASPEVESWSKEIFPDVRLVAVRFARMVLPNMETMNFGFTLFRNLLCPLA